MGALARGSVAGSGRVVEWVFTDRVGGASTGAFAGMNVSASVGDDPDAVAANRRAAAQMVGGEALAMVRQVHGRDVALLREAPVDPPHADAIVTDLPGLAIAVQTADCVPLLLADLRSGRIAAVHAGWRGVVADVVGAAMERLAPEGEVGAWIGPAICPGCYEVGDEVRDQVVAVVPETAAVTRAGTPAIDVRAGVLAQLRRHGVTGVLVGGCTFEDPALYSYRREVPTGRQAGVIIVHEDTP